MQTYAQLQNDNRERRRRHAYRQGYRPVRLRHRRKNKEELMKNFKEAIQAYLEALKEHGEPVPIETVQIRV